ncbi:ecto-ADP-ribosyltransferase 3 isoform X2 [Mus musculus]|uniref:ecto-ADP-ribosyltransferase 3 isoform X2 n=1 Tax=Mus musculus TaxID=10090 RepID=UPI0003D76378|nr:ecto-ADP-ribosyltransferase 3 isoform X2 [Mus musculus]|eukprot:XP_006534776.1 PREDICTED: ecto-ADP-ribosyltransferase 3 isoform X2 [Mus musculus]
MKMGHFEMVTTLLAAAVLMDIFQVKAEVLDMAENAFDDEYLKCKSRMESKYIPQMKREEWANDALLRMVWDNAEIQWEARKAQLFLPRNFKDTYGIALTAYVNEAQEQTSFYHTFSSAVKMAGLSRRRYIYNFPFKAFHFYLVRALQLLRRPCEKSYKTVVYSTSPDISFTFGEQNQARLGNFTLAYSAKPETADNQRVLTIQTCFGVAVGKFLNKEDDSVVLIPLSEVFQVSRKGTSNDLVLQSINSTCSYYECAFLGGLKTENCIANAEYIDPRYLYNPDMDNQKLEDSVPGIKPWAPCKLGRNNLDPDRMPEIKVLQTEENPLLPDEKPEVEERPTILLQVWFQVRNPIPLHPLAIRSFHQSWHPPFYSLLLL